MEGKAVINYEEWLRKREKEKASHKNSDPFEDLKYSYRSTSSFSAQRRVPTSSSIQPYTGPWTDWEKRHLIRRTSYGCRKEDLQALSGLSLTQAVDLILSTEEAMPSPPVNWYQYLFPDENGLAYGQDWTRNAINHYGPLGAVTNLYRSESLKGWLLAQCLNKSISIREKMVHFWYHFIPVNFDDVYVSENIYCATNSARICYDYMQMFRSNALGNYKQIIRKVATEPAMMYYLNNQANSATAPDENFAREVMELFTIGSNLGNTYTQSDVIQAAKLLSGWRVLNLNTPNPVATFVPSLHDFSTKQFSAFFNNHQIPGTGASELDAFIDMLFSKDTIVARHLCRRLYRFFIYYDIDEEVEANFIEPLANVLIENNWNVKPVLKVMFNSEHFFDMANRGVMIKSPMDFVVGNMREMSLQFNISSPSNHYAQYSLYYLIHEEVLATMAQSIGEIPNVSGWSAFYQRPSFYQFWINSNTLQARYKYLQTMVTGFVTIINGAIIQLKFDELQYVLNQFPNEVIQNPNTLIDQVIQAWFPVDFPSEQKTSIKRMTLLNNQINDSYWTQIWNSYKAAPTNNTFINTVRNRLKALFVHLLQLAEFHLS